MSLKALENYPDVSFIDNMTLEDMQNQLISDFKEKYEEVTGQEITLGKADPVRMILYAATLQLYQGMQYIDNAAKQSFLKYSKGDFLDNLGALKGIVRNPGTPARTTMRFTLSEERHTITLIPLGTRVTPGGNIFFYTEEEKVIPAGELFADIPVVCTETGESGNDYETGSIKILVDKIPYIAAVSNTEKTSGGAEIEDDENFAERIYIAPSKYSVAGPDDAYKYWVKNYNPSITDVAVDSPLPGTVDIRFVVNDGEIPNAEMIKAVEDYLKDEKIRPLTDFVTVAAPETVEFNISVKYWINETDKAKEAAIQKNVNDAVNGYKSWQRQKLARDINPSMLNFLVVQAGAKRVEITEPVFTVVGKVGIALAVESNIVYGGIESD